MMMSMPVAIEGGVAISKGLLWFCVYVQRNPKMPFRSSGRTDAATEREKDTKERKKEGKGLQIGRAAEMSRPSAVWAR